MEGSIHPTREEEGIGTLYIQEGRGSIGTLYIEEHDRYYV